MRRADSLEKTLILGKIEARSRGDDRGWNGWMASLTRWMFVWTALGVSNGQGSLACCSPWGRKELDTTEQLNSYPYMTIGKSIALSRQIFVGKVVCLLFITLFRFVTAFLPRKSYLGHEDLFYIVILYILANFSWYLLLLLGPYHFCPLLYPSLHEMSPWYL